MSYKNIYVSILFILLALLALNIVVFRAIVPKIFPQHVPRFLVIFCAATFLIGIGSLVATIILYARAEERITRATYVDIAKELGGEEAVLRKIEQPQYGSRRIPGIWAEVNIKYKDYNIIFAGENVLGSNRFGCFRYFLITIKMDDKFLCTQEDLFTRLSPEAKKLFNEMQKRLNKGLLFKEHRVQLLCQERKLSCRVPLTRKVTLHDLQTAMDILLSISQAK